jgi:hypothetical protein
MTSGSAGAAPRATPAHHQQRRPPDIGTAQFTAFTDPGYAKIAFSIRVEPDRLRPNLVITKTRAATTDACSRRRFAVYCKLIGPCSALIRGCSFGW